MSYESGCQKELRIEQGLTQQQLADILKIDRFDYGKYELDNPESSNDMLIKLSKFFEVSADYVLGLED